jgi:hypothetical protein
MSTLRRIRSLRVRAPSDALARRAGLLVEDALRTASIPDTDGGRVYIVRRVTLPPVRTTASSNTLALALEHRLASLRATAVHASDPRAATADVVFFDDAADLHGACIRAVARSDTHAWFWRSAEPSDARRLAPRERLRRALLRLAAAPQAPAALPHVVAAALAEGWLDAVLDALQPEDGPVLLAAFAPQSTSDANADPPSTPAASSHDSASFRTPPRWTELVRTWAERWGRDDARTLWLAATAVAAARPPTRMAARHMAAAARALLAHVITESTPEVAAAAAAADVTTGLIGTHAPSAQRAQSRVRPPGAPSESQASARTPDVTDVAPGAEAAPRDVAPTAAGGLLFLVQVLRGLDFDAFLDTHAGAAAADLGADVLRAIALRTGTPPDDPIFAAIGFPGDADASPHTRAVPAIGRRQRLRQRAGSAGAVSAASSESHAVREWVRAARVWCRRNAGVGLHTLVRRPALLSRTRTHVDIVFALRAADVRLRRAGLDVDPGWVPWLGRVVLFHYGTART